MPGVDRNLRLGTLALALAGCADHGADEAEPGRETGACIEGTCLGGLACLSDVCVLPQGASSATSGPAGTAGDDGVGTTMALTGDGADGSSGGGSSGDPLACEVPPCTSFARDVQPIFERICSACHNPTGQWLTFLLDGNAVTNYGRIVGVPGPTQPFPGSDVSLVEPCDPANSYLYAKLTGTHEKLGASPGLRQMPLLGEGTDADPWVPTPLPDEQLALIEAWILECAPP